MGLFDKKKENSCCKENACEICSVKVLGSGCKNCQKLYENAQNAVKTMGLDLEVEYVTDMGKIAGYGVMSMPALVVNDKVVSMGKVPNSGDIEMLIHKCGNKR